VAERRLVAVLGYSRRRGEGLHPVCTARLRAAEGVADGAAAVLLSGWARRRSRPSEATLMEDAWAGPPVRLIADGDARSTLGNARAVAAAAHEVEATSVTLVTSSWHRARAAALVRAALDPRIRLEIVSPPPTRPLGLLGRELACFAALPLQLAISARRWNAARPDR
jgi:uncharacterized SAM-binding protein YcdF (DUF218 family)